MNDTFRRYYFNSRPSARGDASCNRVHSSHVHFNSRPSARGDIKKCDLALDIYISIHAPPRGATRCGENVTDFNIISIHAPPRGATRIIGEDPGDTVFQFTPLREGRRKLRRLMIRMTYFNSRPSARGDPALWQGGHAPNPISIHAPPRGATRTVRFIASCPFLFQFTPLREGRLCRGALFGTPSHFNSRPSARGDVRVIATPHIRFYFNSRPSARGDKFGRCYDERILFQFTPLREGRQDYLLSEVLTSVISIHAPPRGATGIPVTSGGNYTISIHAPPRGATRLRPHTRWTGYFNSRPSARGDAKAAVRVHAAHISIHAPPRGATASSSYGVLAALFQFTPLREGRHTGCRRSTPPFGFQFTPLREGRQGSVSPICRASDFNSRPSARGDSRRTSR